MNLQNPASPDQREAPFKNLLASARGKEEGDVAKSAAAVILALCLAQRGASVSLPDADRCAPNIPRSRGFCCAIACDQGISASISHPDAEISIAFHGIAGKLMTSIGVLAL